MQSLAWNLYFRLQSLLASEEGQETITYAMMIGLLALSAVTSMKGLATQITGIFTNVRSTLNAA